MNLSVCDVGQDCWRHLECWEPWAETEVQRGGSLSHVSVPPQTLSLRNSPGATHPHPHLHVTSLTGGKHAQRLLYHPHGYYRWGCAEKCVMFPGVTLVSHQMRVQWAVHQSLFLLFYFGSSGVLVGMWDLVPDQESNWGSPL